MPSKSENWYAPKDGQHHLQSISIAPGVRRFLCLRSRVSRSPTGSVSMGDPGRRLPSMEELAQQMRALTRSTQAVRSSLLRAQNGSSDTPSSSNRAPEGGRVLGVPVGVEQSRLEGMLGRIEEEIKGLGVQLRDGLGCLAEEGGASIQTRLDALEGIVRRMEKQLLVLLNAREPEDAQKTAMALAAKDGDWRSMNVLLGQQLNPNAVLDADGRTALHIAAEKGQAEVVDSLLCGGANKDIRLGNSNGWQGDKKLPKSFLSWGPGAVVFRGQLYTFHQGFANMGKLLYNVFDGVNWTLEQRVPEARVSCGPTVAVYEDRLYCLYMAEKSGGSLRYSVFDGEEWSDSKTVPDTFIMWGPSAVVFQGKLFCCYQARGQPGKLAYNVFDGTSWAGDTLVAKVALSHGPSATVFQGALYCFHQDGKNTGRLRYAAFDGKDWSFGKEVENTRMSCGPSAIQFNGKLYCFHQGGGDFWNIWYNVFDGERWEGDRRLPNTWVTYSPSAVEFERRLYCFHHGVANSSEVWYNVLPSGELDGTTPLHLAAMNGHASVCEVLIRNGADAEAATCDGDTPLHFGAKNGEEEVVRLLLSSGAARGARNRSGKTPKQVAEGAVLDLL